MKQHLQQDITKLYFLPGSILPLKDGRYPYIGMLKKGLDNLGISAGWGLKGNSGTDSSVDFIGTKDDQSLVFKVNNLFSGFLDNINGNTSFGLGSLQYLTEGGANTAFGYSSLVNVLDGVGNTAVGSGSSVSITSGIYNTSIGTSSLGANSTGNGNVAVGGGALASTLGNYNVGVGHTALSNNTTGTNNIAIGHTAGIYNTTASDQIFINSLSRADYLGDQTKSPIYIQQAAAVANQKIYLNGLMNLSYVPTYADNASAITGGLVAGNIYKINAGGTYTLAIVV